MSSIMSQNKNSHQTQFDKIVYQISTSHLNRNIEFRLDSKDFLEGGELKFTTQAPNNHFVSCSFSSLTITIRNEHFSRIYLGDCNIGTLNIVTDGINNSAIEINKTDF